MNKPVICSECYFFHYDMFARACCSHPDVNKEVLQYQIACHRAEHK